LTSVDEHSLRCVHCHLPLPPCRQPPRHLDDDSTLDTRHSTHSSFVCRDQPNLNKVSAFGRHGKGVGKFLFCVVRTWKVVHGAWRGALKLLLWSEQDCRKRQDSQIGTRFEAHETCFRRKLGNRKLHIESRLSFFLRQKICDHLLQIACNKALLTPVTGWDVWQAQIRRGNSRGGRLWER